MQCAYFTTIPVIILAWICLLLVIKIAVKPSENSIKIAIDGELDVEIDKKLNFKKNPSGFKNRIKYHVPKFMLELYEKNKRLREDNNYTKPDIVRSLIPKHAGTINDNEVVEELSDNHLLVFDLPSENEEEKFVSAELKILTLVEINSKIISGVERQLKISVYDDIAKSFYNLDKIHVYHLNNTWLSFNLTLPVIKILQKKNERFLKIVISISDFLPYYQKSGEENNLKLSLMPMTENFEHDYPILILSYTSNNSNRKTDLHKMRKKRSIEEDYEEETNNVWDEEPSKKIHLKKLNKRMRNTCRRKPLYIDFAEIDYNQWIVQPPGYEAYQCQGKCFYPVAEHLNPTKHAIVQALLHSVAPSKASRSCCVPTILDSISILYVDNKGVLTYRYAYKDMVVLECGCR